ncbi:hypothetical protein CYFUS_006563 [Cystobacter fuscus]|uniref:Scramblase n=1 Tax=Cystobacter fuscus TaxID=43 RepID=A0A250JCH1_9BACT|nr:phospholipid scramblase-related protein [Cystobacter fuscus]ATB41101.1 hypothetical protein CYFUS_006563 [Cystobacter fuscus]
MSESPKWTTENSGLELDWKERATPEERGQQAARSEGEAGRGAPGDPRYMGPGVRLALASLLEGPGLTVRQLREWGESLTGWETRNRYEAIDHNGHFMLFIGEAGSGLGQSLLRNFLPFRSLELECMTKDGILALSLKRAVTLFFTHVEVTAWDGRPLGYIQQRWGLVRRHFDLCTPAGVVMATLTGPLWRPWTFTVRQKGEEVAVIRKQWSGFVSEAFTDADTFGVEFRPGLTDGRLRQLVLAATLMVDLCYFEERDNSQGTLLGALSDD